MTPEITLALTTALQSFADDAVGLIGTVLPIAILVMAAFVLVRKAIGFFKHTSGLR